MRRNTNKRDRNYDKPKGAKLDAITIELHRENSKLTIREKDVLKFILDRVDEDENYFTLVKPKCVKSENEAWTTVKRLRKLVRHDKK